MDSFGATEKGCGVELRNSYAPSFFPDEQEYDQGRSEAHEDRANGWRSGEMASPGANERTDNDGEGFAGRPDHGVHSFCVLFARSKSAWRFPVNEISVLVCRWKAYGVARKRWWRVVS